MEKLNIAKLLKDCPSGMELDCTMCDNVSFDTVQDGNVYPIKINTPEGRISLTKYGCYSCNPHSKCVIFPKGKTTWEGFVPPCKFKTGDVLYIDCADKESDGDVYKYIFILKEIDSLHNYFSYCHLSIDRFFPSSNYLADNRYTPRFATSEEKQKLFDAIKANGYKWNAETKTLEKLIEPKFKVGDRIKSKINQVVYTITDVREDAYLVNENTGKFHYHIPISGEKNYELVSNKFDINALKPFTKVLVRCSSSERWHIQLFEKYNRELGAKYPFIGLFNNKYSQCVPYEGNEYLFDTTDDCDEYYKTWKQL